MRRTTSLAFVVLAAAVPVFAQTTASGSVHGVARDETGAVVPGVTVSATSPTVPGGAVTTTDRVGHYRLGDDDKSITTSSVRQAEQMVWSIGCVVVFLTALFKTLWRVQHG